MTAIKILFVHGGTLSKAGTEAYMMSVFRNVDPSQIHIDFLVFGQAHGYYDQEVLSQGSKIYRLPMTPSQFLHGKPTIRQLKNKIIAEHYDIVHSHMNALNPHILKYMKKLGIRVRISHSHGSAHFIKNKLAIAYKEQLKKKIPKYATDLLACSEEAGDFMYGNHPYTINNNAIDTLAFTYNETKRNAIRQELGISDKLVFGNVARFNFIKNPLFLLDVFALLKKDLDHAVLVMVGDGEMHQQIEDKIVEYGLQDSVLILGMRDDVERLYLAFDHFLFPSVSEGFAYVLVEAQTSGLQCFSSNTVPHKRKMTENFYFLPIDDPRKWRDFILGKLDYERKDQRQLLIDSGYDEADNVKKLVAYYQNCLKKSSAN